MRKRNVAILIICISVLFSASSVSASDSISSVNTSETIVYDSYTGTISGLSDPETVLPIDIIQSPEIFEIRKIYELSPDVNPQRLPRDSFERNGIVYECTDILREVVIGEQIQDIVQTETIESPKNDMDTILGLLKETKTVTTEDGFTGILYLDISSVRTDVSGYGSTSKSISATRSYPNLSNADTRYIPKTIEDNGNTLTLKNVDWQSDNTMNVDDYEITDRYIAVATYTGTQSVSYIKGYTVTADYIGEVFKTGVSKIRYTVIFAGSESESEEESSQSTDFLMPAIIIIAVVTAAAAAIIYMLYKKKKEKEMIRNEETHINDPAAIRDDNADERDSDGSGEL